MAINRQCFKILSTIEKLKHFAMNDLDYFMKWTTRHYSAIVKANHLIFLKEFKFRNFSFYEVQKVSFNRISNLAGLNSIFLIIDLKCPLFCIRSSYQWNWKFSECQKVEKTPESGVFLGLRLFYFLFQFSNDILGEFDALQKNIKNFFRFQSAVIDFLWVSLSENFPHQQSMKTQN